MTATFEQDDIRRVCHARRRGRPARRVRTGGPGRRVSLGGQGTASATCPSREGPLAPRGTRTAAPGTPEAEGGLHRGIGQAEDGHGGGPSAAFHGAFRACLLKAVRVLRAGGPRTCGPAPTVIQRTASASSAETVLPPGQGVERRSCSVSRLFDSGASREPTGRHLSGLGAVSHGVQMRHYVE
jgi:hypothetical protein